MFVSLNDIYEKIQSEHDISTSIKYFCYKNNVNKLISQYRACIFAYKDIYKKDKYDKLMNEYHVETVFYPFYVISGSCERIDYWYTYTCDIPHEVEYEVSEEYETWDSIQDENGIEIGRENEQTHVETHMETRTEYETVTKEDENFCSGVSCVCFDNPYDFNDKVLNSYDKDFFDTISIEDIKNSNLRFILCKDIDEKLKKKFDVEFKQHVDTRARNDLSSRSSLNCASMRNVSHKEEIIYIPVAILKTFDGKIYKMDCYSEEVNIKYNEQPEYVREDVKNKRQLEQKKAIKANRNIFISRLIINGLILALTTIFLLSIFFNSLNSKIDYIDLIYGLYTKRYHSGNAVVKYIFEYGMLALILVCAIFYIKVLCKLKSKISKTADFILKAVEIKGTLKKSKKQFRHMAFKQFLGFKFICLLCISIGILTIFLSYKGKETIESSKNYKSEINENVILENEYYSNLEVIYNI